MAIPSSRLHINKFNIKVLIRSSIAVVCVWLLFSVVSSVLSVHFFLASQFHRAAVCAQLARPASYLPFFLSLKSVKLAQVWPITLEGIILASASLDASQETVNQYNQSGVLSLAGFEPKLPEVLSLLERAQDVIPSPRTTQLRALAHLLEQVMKPESRMLILIQGPDELRPTGGFIGAYIIIEWKNGQVATLQFEDIYDAAGQFQSSQTPPSGVREYLSGGAGWNLPDANWSPHFPSSAETINAMMKQANKGGFSTIISLNTTLLYDVLGVTGPVPLPEYQSELSQSTLDTLLADHRKEYFPGSRAKANLLAQAVPHIIRAVGSLAPSQQLALARIILTALDNKDIQIWSDQPDLQTILEQAQVAGSLSRHPPIPFQSDNDSKLDNQVEWIGLVEANVGINKINPFITRTYLVEKVADEVHLSVTWNNTATPDQQVDNTESSPRSELGRIGAPAPEASHSAYVNYVRLLLSSNIVLQNSSGPGVSQGESAPLAAEQTLASNASLPPSDLFLSPFLVIIRPGETVTQTFTLKLLRPETGPLILWKQSGVPATDTTIISGETTQTFLHTKDTNLFIPSL